MPTTAYEYVLYPCIAYTVIYHYVHTVHSLFVCLSTVFLSLSFYLFVLNFYNTHMLLCGSNMWLSTGTWLPLYHGATLPISPIHIHMVMHPLCWSHQANLPERFWQPEAADPFPFSFFLRPLWLLPLVGALINHPGLLLGRLVLAAPANMNLEGGGTYL